VARYAPGNTTVLLGSGGGGVVGSNGTAPASADFLGVESAKTGIYALENVDLFNLLVLPGVEDAGILATAVAYAERRRAFVIVDLPATTDTLAEAEAWLGGTGQSLRSRNAAAYFPWYREPDPLMGNVVRAFPPSGALAGLYARTDSERGVWKAPAGTEANIRGAVGLTSTLTDRENGVLNPQGLNVLRTFPTIGTVAWGARTLRGADLFADEYKYIPIRRLALYLEESLYRGTQWVVFEPNDEPLWSQIRLNLGSFMHTLFRQGAFQGRSPREAYFVKCDRETNPQADVDRGIVNIAVGFAPLKPAEFVILRIQQIAPTP
jgi:phage tail sheath protein FI